MKLFLDSADINEIKTFAKWRVIDGITTTPTFFRRLGVGNARKSISDINAQFKGEIHIEALGNTVEKVMDAAKGNRELGENIVSKIPIGPIGLEAASRLEEQGIRVNLHLIFSVNQAIMAAKAGVMYVCPLMGRLNDAGLNGSEIVSDIVSAIGVHPELSTVVMVSSIRNAEDARAAFLSGAKAVTIPGKVLNRIFESPFTEKAHNLLAADLESFDLVSEHMRPATSVPVLSCASTVQDAMVEMTLKKIGIVAVVSERKLTGVVTDGDLRRALKDSVDNQRLSIEEIMTRQPKCVSPDDLVQRAVDMMKQHRMTEVVVVDGNDEPAGLLNLHDLMVGKGGQK
jgi:transaldolase